MLLIKFVKFVWPKLDNNKGEDDDQQTQQSSFVSDAQSRIVGPWPKFLPFLSWSLSSSWTLLPFMHVLCGLWLWTPAPFLALVLSPCPGDTTDLELAWDQSPACCHDHGCHLLALAQSFLSCHCSSCPCLMTFNPKRLLPSSFTVWFLAFWKGSYITHQLSTPSCIPSFDSSSAAVGQIPLRAGAADSRHCTKESLCSSLV